MKFTEAWLREHLDTSATLDEIVAHLTSVGLEVEDVHDPSAGLESFVVATVVEAAPHPNADKLQVCRVDAGQGELQVVCGAPNARTGMKGVFAPAGSRIPGSGIQLEPTEIRGVQSNGMLLSEKEVGISDDHAGIIELDADAPVGASYATYAGLDPVIEIAITPNRQDCLGVRGIARDLAAAGLGTLQPYDTTAIPGQFPSPIDVRFEFDAATASACPHFVGRYIRGVKNGPSPKWLQDRLRSIGLRPISALVDITNFSTYDLGRPLHVFDADRVQGNIHVRLGRAGEQLVGLDDREYEVGSDQCMICDDSGVLAFGGVMGGLPSGCTEETVNVFIESAYFDPVRTAGTGRAQQIDSDARYRFERGVDPEFAQPGAEVATRLVLECCGGEPGELVITGAPIAWQRSVPFRPERVLGLGGMDVGKERSRAILEALGFTCRDAGDRLEVSVPSWRGDIDGEADLVEEVCRIHGYDNIPSAPLPRHSYVARPSVDATQRRVRIARRALAARGLLEAVTWAFVPRAHAELFGGGAPELILANPISADLDAMRPCILPSLLAAAGRNLDRGFADLALFEVGGQYADDTPEGQARVAAGIRRGATRPRHWSGAARDVDALDVKADALAALESIGTVAHRLQVERSAPPWYHPGRSGVLQLGAKNRLACFGELHPGILEAMDIKGPIMAFEVFLDAVPRPRTTGPTRPAQQASDYQAVERDFAFEVDSSVAADQIVRAAGSASRDLVVGVVVFDVYEGEHLPAGKKSVAISVRLQAQDRTLTEAEIDAVAEKVVARVGKTTGGVLRG